MVNNDASVVTNDAIRRKNISGPWPTMMSNSSDAEAALLDVIEGFCPLCRVRLIPHDDTACCPCGGCSFRADGHSLLMGSCDVHPVKRCEHWEAIWQLVPK